MRHRFINHARNVWDRAVSLLPRIDQLWYKVREQRAVLTMLVRLSESFSGCPSCCPHAQYIHMEEMLGNVAGARQVFERWMRFEPDHQGWMAYIKVRRV